MKRFSRNGRMVVWAVLAMLATVAVTCGYFTRPAVSQTVAAIPAAQSCSRGASAGYLTPRLQVGAGGRSVHVGNLNIRVSPGTGSRSIGSISPGDTFAVLEGSACVGNYVWWKLNVRGVQGWVAEGEPSSFVYWLEPTIAQSLAAPRIESVGSVAEVRSYRLTVSDPQDIVYVYCPANTAPKMGYLSNVEAVQCEPV